MLKGASNRFRPMSQTTSTSWAARGCIEAGRLFAAATVFALAAAGAWPDVAWGTNRYWDAGGGTDTNWSNASNWSSNAEPTSSDTAYIGRTGYASPATAYITEPGEVCDSLHLGYGHGNVGTLHVTGGNLTATGSVYVGYNGSGTMEQAGGAVTVDTSLSVGHSPDAPCTYILSNGTLNTAETVLEADSCIFDQIGGAHAATSMFLDSGALYCLRGGNLTVTGDITGDGALSMSGGTLHVGGTFSGELITHGPIDFGFDFTVGKGCENYGTLDVPVLRTLTFNGCGLTNRGTVMLSGGELDGNGALNDFNGTISGQGSIVTSLTNHGMVDANGLLRITGIVDNLGVISASTGDTLNIDAELANEGAITLYGGMIAGAGTINCKPGGTIQGGGGLNVPISNHTGLIRANCSMPLVITDLVGGNPVDGELAVADGGALRIDAGFANYGIVTMEGATGILAGGTIDNENLIAGCGRVTNALNNHGVIRADGGTLTLSAAVFVNPAGGTLEAESGSKLLVTQGLSSSEGDILLRGGTLESAVGATTNAGLIAGHGTLRTGGLTNTGSVMVGGGDLDVIGDVVNNGAISAGAGRTALFFGDVSGTGSFTGPGTYVFLGELSPGNSPGVMDFAGSVMLTGGSVLRAELGDDDNSNPLSPHYDSLCVAGDVTIGGDLALTRAELAGQAGRFGGTYNLMVYQGVRTGEFDSVDTELAAYLDGPISYDVDLGDGWKAVQVSLHDLLDGDADLDGTVGLADMQAVASGLAGGGAGQPDGDLNCDGRTDAADYILLKGSMGQSIPAGGGGGVPEPASLALLAAGFAGLLARRRRT